MDNLSALGAARRRWWIILLMAGLGAALGALPTPERVQQQAVRYSATHTMLLNNEADSANSGVSPNQVAFFAVTGEVPKRAAERISYAGNPAALASQVAVTFDYSVGALTVTTTQDDATRAEAVADAFAEELNSYLAERQDAYNEDRLAASTTRLSTLESQINDLVEQQEANPDDNVVVAKIDALRRQYSVAFEQNQTLSEATTQLAFTTLERAQAVPLQPEGLAAPTSRVTRGVMGLLVGGAVGLGIAMLLGIFDRRIRTREQAEEVLGMRARVLIPTAADTARAGVVVLHGRHDPLSDSYRTVRNVVAFVHEGLPVSHRARVTVVVSAGPGEGKTSLAANLAAAFAEAGRSTIAINTDFRRPRLAVALTGAAVPYHPFSLDDVPQLTPAQLLTSTDDPALSLLDLSKLGEAGELARTTARLVPTLATTVDDIVIDTSPVGSTAEVLELLPVADVILMVVRVGHTQAEAAERAIAIVRDLTTAPVLMVLTGTRADGSNYYEYNDRRSSRTPSLGVAKARWNWRHPLRKPYTGPERRKAPRPSEGRGQRSTGGAERQRVDDPGLQPERQSEPVE